MDQRQDAALRVAAVEQPKRVAVAGIVTADDLKDGVLIGGVRLPLINPQRGIFTAAAMRFVLSLRTVYTRSGRKVENGTIIAKPIELPE